MKTKELLLALQNNDRKQISQLFPSNQRTSNMLFTILNSKNYNIQKNVVDQPMQPVSTANNVYDNIIKIITPNFISTLEFNTSIDQAIYWLIKNKKSTQVIEQKNYTISKSLFFYSCFKGDDTISNLFITQLQSSKNGVCDYIHILELGLSIATQYKQTTITNLLSNYLNSIPNKINTNLNRPLEVQFLTACQNKQIDFIRFLLNSNNNINLTYEGLELLIENKAKDSDILDIYRNYYLPKLKKENVFNIFKSTIKAKNIHLFEQIFKSIRKDKNIIDDKLLIDVIKSSINNNFTNVFKNINFLAHLTEKQIMDAHMQVINNFSMANKFLSSQGNSNQYQLKEQYFIYSIKQFKKLKMLSSSNIIKLFLIIARRGLSNLIELGFNSKLLNINNFNKSLINNNCDLLKRYNETEIINFITHRLNIKLTKQQLDLIRPFNSNLVKSIEQRYLFDNLHNNLQTNKPSTGKLLKI